MKKLFFLPLLAAVTACQPVGIADQARLSRPIFEFAGSGTRSYETSLSSQLETGRASSSNAAAGGCSSCH